MNIERDSVPLIVPANAKEAHRLFLAASAYLMDHGLLEKDHEGSWDLVCRVNKIFHTFAAKEVKS